MAAIKNSRIVHKRNVAFLPECFYWFDIVISTGISNPPEWKTKIVFV